MGVAEMYLLAVVKLIGKCVSESILIGTVGFICIGVAKVYKDWLVESTHGWHDKNSTHTLC